MLDPLNPPAHPPNRLICPGVARRLPRLLIGWAVVLMVLLIPVTAAQAFSVESLPDQPPAAHVLDQAEVLSRASRTEIDNQLEILTADRVDARLITVNHLDYGLSLDQLGEQLLGRWSPAGGSDSPSLLLLLIDSQTKATAIVASPKLERQLPSDLLRSTARTTMAAPLRAGDRYRQASLDALSRLTSVLRGSDDPGEPLIDTVTAPVSTVPTMEETRDSNAFTWVVVLLVVGTVVPMLTWWVFSR